ncbi:MAG TPA: 4-alpha-glucanotransferase [Polyangia bacterium]|jgi:4-alpha-glucanotransferase|nr:4-alpha-glucanotransferase [Polyangia bacterium]
MPHPPFQSLVVDDAAPVIRDALDALEIERLAFAVHDASFPSVPAEDIGRGSPYGLGARTLLRLIGRLGFNVVQLGPQGDTPAADSSPYAGALLSKSPLSIALAALEESPDWAELAHGLRDPLVAARPAGPSDRTEYGYAWKAARQALAALHARLRAAPARFAALADRFADYRRRRDPVLRADAEFEALAEAHGTDDWRRWSGRPPGAVEATVVDRYLFGQFILDQQHQELRQRAASDGLALYADLQIGFSHRDLWSRGALFRADYLMGAPPSRTNPDGQPWGFPVLDPAQYFAARTPPGSPTPRLGPVLEFFATRIERALEDFDGLRIDHPHGLVCPWVYSAADPDPAAAVMRGARLFSSPDLPDHPALAALAITRPDQLARADGVSRYADDWVRTLDDDQIDRFGVLLDALMARVAAAGRSARDVVCEVLSTWPFPVRAVMQRHGLGRFCVTQKADLTRAADAYRTENASERDWIMVGTHDTPPIWRLGAAWHGTPAGGARAAYLAERLSPAPELRPALARWLAADARHLCQAMFADLFTGRARRVSVFFADLFGRHEIYNRPGTVDPANWTLRLPGDFAEDFHRRLADGSACNVPLALALALNARGPALGHTALLERLMRAARAQSPALDPGIFDWLSGSA